MFNQLSVKRYLVSYSGLRSARIMRKARIHNMLTQVSVLVRPLFAYVLGL